MSLSPEDDLDVRIRRTRDRLRRAVLELASEHPVEEITVADLVRVARINRTTFYKHAASPADVLAEILYADLDRIRAGWLDGAATIPETWERSAAELAEHLLRYDALYTVGLVGQRSAVLYRLLIDHFAASARGLMDRDPALLPDGPGPREWRARAYSSFIAHGQVGIIEAWLSEPTPRDPALLISVSAATMSTGLHGL
ncbi:TetR/AcrR family transcriptional regulator [Actinoplanes couchii]|uniref:HTH tetR-type domain-containing protein n=1 Tax=Actinoplanes couchii TaxID=403638 RepID=A0ABQ3X8R0_9ACTN|nr:hypothetical protein [Actinoplanes couchii]MDR6320101.1 AcrR family transcriptional regulator [Actinoplanes couchii]GID54884.1 hypothetical protein Aco03nite_032880 [Actinoplanes couchii]